jgi:hypothetical protein
MTVALREARAVARRTAQPTNVAIEATGKAYIADGREFPLPSGETVTFQPYLARPDAQKNALVFLPDGSSSGGALIFKHADDSVRIDVDWLTGRVSLGD